MARKPKTQPHAQPAAPAPVATGPAKADEGDVQLLTIADIMTDCRNDRLDRLVDQDDLLRELAGSMRERGLLEPVVVGKLEMSDGGTILRLVAGHRRLAAARLLGWTTIRAVVRTYITDDDLQLDRATENVHRLNLNPIEEAYAVGGMIDAAMGPARQAIADEALKRGTLAADDPSDVRLEAAVRKRAIEIVAGRLGKSVTWVSDRSLLSRLAGKARDLVLEGRLPMAHAREICKVADPARRNELAAKYAAADKPGARPGDFGELRSEVAGCIMSLHQVPWKLDVPFAGAPACERCPKNSANIPRLFEHHQPCQPGYHGPGAVYKEPAAGVCTDRACFGEKSAATNRLIASRGKTLARRVRELPKAERPAAVTAKSVAELGAKLKVDVPRHVEPSRLAARATEEMSRRPEPKRSVADNRPAVSQKSAAEEARKQAFSKLWNALAARSEKIEKAVLAKIAADPMRRAALAIAQSSTLWQDLSVNRWSGRDRAQAQKAAEKPGLQQLINMLVSPTPEGFRQAGEFLKVERLSGDYQDISPETDVIDRIAKAFDVPVPPRPTLEQFTPAAPPPEKPAKGHKDEGPAERAKASKKAGKAKQDADDLDLQEQDYFEGDDL
ncbi:MAG: ParB/RepB/Spo0J family partition protein [Phycisphaerales bacterium]|nr:ParB/RepB/Spo0J family partition protein [Phycisphaerales bacterium]